MILDVIAGDEPEFFAPAPSDMIDTLLAQYNDMRGRVERVAAVMNGPDLAGALHYFAEAAAANDRHLSSTTVERMFDAPAAVAYLNAAFWSKAMHMTDVLDVMPQARRDAWHAQMSSPLGEKRNRYDKDWVVEPIPEFNDDNVRGTLAALLAQRDTFFAERVDGIFRALSRTHVTNAPEGFNRRMILSGVTDSFGYSNSRTGVINDLRCVIARFMGRDEPGYDATGPLVRYARQRRGEWVAVDGGALRLRCYQVGTAHLEVHPDMAWRLNCVLARLYPLAIPTEFRERPKRKTRTFAMIGRPLPFAVLARLSGLTPARDLNPGRGFRDNTYVDVPGCYDFRYGGNGVTPDAVIAEADRVLAAMGGTPVSKSRWRFDYNPLDAVQEIVASGCLPDQKAHQFYPTQERLARIAVDLADIGPEDRVLEPSAGMGGIADLLPADRTTCVEISAMHCRVLEAKGFNTVEADFLTVADAAGYDRVVMNPPFSDGRWKAHVEHAAGLLRPGGRLVAIVPASARQADLLPGWSLDWHGPYDNEFPGTSVSVRIVVAKR